MQFVFSTDNACMQFGQMKVAPRLLRTRSQEATWCGTHSSGRKTTYAVHGIWGAHVVSYGRVTTVVKRRVSSAGVSRTGGEGQRSCTGVDKGLDAERAHSTRSSRRRMALGPPPRWARERSKHTAWQTQATQTRTVATSGRRGRRPASLESRSLVHRPQALPCSSLTAAPWCRRCDRGSDQQVSLRAYGTCKVRTYGRSGPWRPDAGDNAAH
jgi:hypothetical protein